MENILEDAMGGFGTGMIVSAGLSTVKQIVRDENVDIEEVLDDSLRGGVTGAVLGAGIGLLDDLFD